MIFGRCYLFCIAPLPKKGKTEGMKVAQAVLSKCYSGRVVNLVKVDNINDKDRGDNGFGSTGI